MRNIPDDVTTAWGARWIWPNDFVHNRQDFTNTNTDERERLTAWLNRGAIRVARDNAAALARQGRLSPTEDREVVLYEDDAGVLKANPQASHGYLYVAAWLKP